MNRDQTLELISIDALLDKVRTMREKSARLVQISATRAQEQLELTYSFDLSGSLVSYRLHVPVAQAWVPSISSIYWCAFLYENEMHDLFNLQVDGMAVDFQGNLYKTAVKYAFAGPGTPTVAAPKTAPAAQTPSSLANN